MTKSAVQYYYSTDESSTKYLLHRCDTVDQAIRKAMYILGRDFKGSVQIYEADDLQKVVAHSVHIEEFQGAFGL